MAFSNRTEEYYKKFIELQDKLRKSEEERLKLEIKFNEMLQMAREEKQTHYLNLRSQYKRFLEEDGRRQDRNERILRTMERIENRISMLVAKTERFKLLRRQYQAFLDRIYKAKETKKFEASSLAEMELSTEKPKDDFVNKQQYLQNLSPKELSVEKPKDDLVEQYLRNLSSQKLKDLLVNENERRERKPFHLTSHERRTDTDTRSPFDSGDFQPNYANSIADDIMNSIYSKNKFDFTSLTREEDSEQRLPTQSVNFNWDSVKDNQEDVIEKDRFRGEENVHKAAFIDKYERESESSDSAASSIRERVHFQAPVKQTIPLVHAEYNSIDKEGKETEVQLPQEEKEEDSVVKTEESVSVVSPKSELKQKEVTLNINETLPTAENENETLSTAENENKILPTAENENETLPTAENEKFENPNQNSDLGLKTDSERNETVTHSNKEEEFQVEEEVGASAITEMSEPVTGALENKEQYGDEALYQQYEENAQYSQQYYNENGQQLYNEYDQIQYDENGQPIQQYDQFGQYSERYDENGQLIQPYDINSQYDQSQFIQYDENGKPILQYDENGQLIQQLEQYDENGQPIQQFEQYDENGQPIQQYYDNEQPIQQQYDEKGQVIENMEIFQQYDQLEQPILESVQEYNENAQPAKQDEHLRYGENGELLPKYENGEQIHTEKGDAPKTPENPDEEANSKNSEIPENEEHSKDESNEKESGRNKKLETGDPQTKHETRNVMEMLDTDSESVRQDTEISNDNDFDFSNG